MFKVGDIVRCVSSIGSDEPQKDREYVVKSADAHWIGIDLRGQLDPKGYADGAVDGTQTNWGNSAFTIVKSKNGEEIQIDTLLAQANMGLKAIIELRKAHNDKVVGVFDLFDEENRQDLKSAKLNIPKSVEIKKKQKVFKEFTIQVLTTRDSALHSLRIDGGELIIGCQKFDSNLL